MRKILRNFLKWLDTRFPEKVVVTQADYLTLKAQMEVVEKILLKVNDDRLKHIEAEINKLNMSLGFGANLKAAGGQTVLNPFNR